MIISYLCDGNNPKCCGAIGCGVNNPSAAFAFCVHTLKEEYAVNGPCADPWNHPDRFRAGRSGERTFYEEI